MWSRAASSCSAIGLETLETAQGSNWGVRGARHAAPNFSQGVPHSWIA
jgi:hypothetical protein